MKPTNSRLLLTVLCVPMFLVLLDVLAMNVAMPALGGAFHLDRGTWPLLVDAHTVPLAVGLPPAGWAVDRIGSRRVMVGGLVVFVAASAFGGAAWSWDTVLAARFIQGLSAAAMLPGGLTALTVAWSTPSARARALGVWSAMSAVATAIGPAVGGLLVASIGWRAVFWINVPLALATVPFVIIGPLTGPLVVRYGRRAVAAAGLGIGGVGLLAAGRLPGAAGVTPVLLGIGLGLMTAAIVGETMDAWTSRPGMAGGANSAFRKCGTSVGVAVGGAFSAHGVGGDVVRDAGATAGVWWSAGALLVAVGFTDSGSAA